MKTRKKLTGILAASLLFAACGGAGENNETNEETQDTTQQETMTAEEVTYMVDTENSTVQWSGEMLGMYSHQGTVSIKEGSITVKDGKVTSGKVVVDMTSITPTDDAYNPEEGKTKEKLVGHLSSGDFFLVEEHPTASFDINGSDNGTVMGDLTVRGNTGQETVRDVTMSEEGGKLKASGNLTFNRQNYEVAFKHPMQEMVLSDDIVLKIDLVASK